MGTEKECYGFTSLTERAHFTAFLDSDVLLFEGVGLSFRFGISDGFVDGFGLLADYSLYLAPVVDLAKGARGDGRVLMERFVDILDDASIAAIFNDEAGKFLSLEDRFLPLKIENERHLEQR